MRMKKEYNSPECKEIEVTAQAVICQSADIDDAIVTEYGEF